MTEAADAAQASAPEELPVESGVRLTQGGVIPFPGVEGELEVTEDERPAAGGRHEVELTSEKPDAVVDPETGSIKYSAEKLGLPQGEEVEITKDQREQLEGELERFFNWIEQYKDFAKGQEGVALPPELEHFYMLYKSLGKEKFLLYSKNFAMAALIADRMEFINMMGIVQHIGTVVGGTYTSEAERERVFRETIERGKVNEFLSKHWRKIGIGVGVGIPVAGQIGGMMGGVAYLTYRLVTSASNNQYTEVRQLLRAFPGEFRGDQVTQFLNESIPEWGGIISYLNPAALEEGTMEIMSNMAELKKDLYVALKVPEGLQTTASWWEAAFVTDDNFNLENARWLLGTDRRAHLRRMVPVGEGAPPDFETWWRGLPVQERIEKLLQADSETFKSLLGSQVVEIVQEGPLPGTAGVIEATEAKLAALRMTPGEWEAEKQGKEEVVKALKTLVEGELPRMIEERRKTRDEVEAKAEGFKEKRDRLNRLHETYNQRIEVLTPEKRQLEQRIQDTKDQYEPEIETFTRRIRQLERVPNPNQVQRNELTGFRGEKDRLNEEKIKLLNPLTTELAKKESEIQAVQDKLDGVDTNIAEGEGFLGELRARNRQVRREERRLREARETIARLNKEIAEGPPKLSEGRIALLTCGKNSLENVPSWLGKATTKAMQEHLTVEHLTSTEEERVMVKSPDEEGGAEVNMVRGHRDILKLIFNPTNEHEWWAAYDFLFHTEYLNILKNRFGIPDEQSGDLTQALGWVRENVSENQFKMVYIDIVWHVRNKLESISGLVVPEAEEEAIAAAA